MDAGSLFPCGPKTGDCLSVADKAAAASGVFGTLVTGEAIIEQEGRYHQRKVPAFMCGYGGGIAHVCYVGKIPFAAVRSISDTEENSGQESFAKYCGVASKNSFKVVELLLEHYQKGLLISQARNLTRAVCTEYKRLKGEDV